MNRGLRNVDAAYSLQDEFRASRRLTLNYGLRWEVEHAVHGYSQPHECVGAGTQIHVVPQCSRPVSSFPAIPASPTASPPVYWKGLMPRIGVAWDPTGHGTTVDARGLRHLLRRLRQRRGRSAAGAAQRTSVDAGAPVAAAHRRSPIRGAGRIRSRSNSFPQPTTVLTIESGMRPPYAQQWNLSVQRSFASAYLIDARYIGTKGTRLPRMIEGNPAVYGPGATADNADRRRLYAGCHGPDSPCDFASVGLITNSTNSTYHAGQISLTRRFTNGLCVSHVLHVLKVSRLCLDFQRGGFRSPPRAGENDLAQNPFDLRGRARAVAVRCSPSRRSERHAMRSHSAAPRELRERCSARLGAQLDRQFLFGDAVHRL